MVHSDEERDMRKLIMKYEKGCVFAAVAVLFMLGAFFNSIMDTLQFRYSGSVFAGHGYDDFFNPHISWKNKWKDGNPAQGEAYPGSSTVFVLFTDAWHLAQFLMFTCFELAVLLLLYINYRLKWYTLLSLFLGMKILFGLTFEIFFKYLLIT